MSDQCKCVEIVEAINKRHPKANWNCDDACREWREISSSLEDKGIIFPDGADENYACTCPTCGDTICGWCV